MKTALIACLLAAGCAHGAQEPQSPTHDRPRQDLLQRWASQDGAYAYEEVELRLREVAPPPKPTREAPVKTRLGVGLVTAGTKLRLDAVPTRR